MYRIVRMMPFYLALTYLLSFPTAAQEPDFSRYLENEEIIIPDEKLNITVSGQKAYLIDVTVDREIAYKINKPSGAALLDTVLLPEPLDETEILHAPVIRQNIGSISGLRMTRFSAVVEKPDGSVRTIEPSFKIISNRIIRTSLGVSYQYEYYFDDLENGDILKLSYSYSFLFRDNWFNLFSTRIFFHSRYPRLSYDFSLTHSSYLETDTFFVNVEPPVFKNENKNKSYSWHMSNLPGCLDESGSRPYKDLPHFIFSLKPYELIYEEFNSFRQDFMPLWLLLCYDREEEISVAVLDQSIGAKDKDNLVYEKMARRFLDMAGTDRSGIKSLQYFQRWMADSVKYDNAALYYDNEENYKVSRPAQLLQGGTLEDYAIEQAYAGMILKLGLNFFTAYPVDKRCGEISERYFAPVYDNDVLFAAILKTNVLAYVLPFSELNRYYCEELPFYYEDIPVMLVNSFDFGGYKLNVLDSARIVKTPESLFTDNTRKIKSTVAISLDSGTAVFNTTVTLAGQYSTMCRMPYLNKPLDPTVNPQYYQPVWDIGRNINVQKVNVGKTDLFFPFTTTISAAYSSQDLVERTEDGYLINLNNWINHITPQDYDSACRFTDYYPDFPGTDGYSYEILFDRDVRLVRTEQNVMITDDFGSYSFSILQLTANKILVSSNFAMKSPVVPKERISGMNRLFREINKCDDLVIKVVPK